MRTREMILAATILLSSCSQNISNPTYTDTTITMRNDSYTIQCIDDIEYVRTNAGIAPHYKLDGQSVYVCKYTPEGTFLPHHNDPELKGR